MEILRDAIWQFIGAILGLVGTVVSVILAFRLQPRKSLSCSIIHRSKLVSIKREVEHKLRVYYEGKAVQNLSLVVIRIQNTGNQPIVANDFVEPVEIALESTVDIIDGEIGGTRPENLRTSLSKIDQRIQLLPTLFNAGDYADINILVDGSVKEIDVHGRVVGVSRIRKVDLADIDVSSRSMPFFGSLAYLITFILAALAIYVLVGAAVEWGAQVIDRMRT